MEERLKVEHLSVSFFTDEGEVQAVRDVSFSLQAGEVLAVVGESGCGKSVLCKSIMKLLPENAKIKNGKILVNGEDLAGCGERRMRELRGKLFSMVFPEPDDVPEPDDDCRSADCRGSTGASKRHGKRSSGTKSDRTDAAGGD